MNRKRIKLQRDWIFFIAVLFLFLLLDLLCANWAYSILTPSPSDTVIEDDIWGDSNYYFGILVCVLMFAPLLLAELIVLWGGWILFRSTIRGLARCLVCIATVISTLYIVGYFGISFMIRTGNHEMFLLVNNDVSLPLAWLGLIIALHLFLVGKRRYLLKADKIMN